MKDSRDTLSGAGLLAGRLPGLLLKVEKVAHSFMRGTHGRRRTGPGDAFWQFRPWQQGDSSRDIDWRQTAKREGAFVRRTEWEAAQTAWLYRDASASMECHAKKDYAEVLLLALGMALLGGGEQVSLLGTDLAPQTGYSSIRRLCESLPAQTHLAENARPVAARSQVILFSDFYFPVAQLASFCEKLAARQVAGLLVQIFAPEEKTLPYAGRVRFQDIEDMGAPPLDIQRVEAIRGEYERKFISHQKELAGLAEGLGWIFEKFGTDMAPETAIGRLYNHLSVKK